MPGLKLNAVRRCLDNLKAGGLARVAYPAQVVSLILSDVVGDPLDFIASGPTVIPSYEQHCNHVQDCLNVLTKYALLDRIPLIIKQFLDHKKHEPIPCDSRQHCSDNWILGNNMIALQAMANFLANSAGISPRVSADLVQKALPENSPFETARQLTGGYDLFPILVTNALQDCAEDQGRRLADLLWESAQHLDMLVSATRATSVSPHLERMLNLLARLRTSTEVETAIAEKLTQVCEQIANQRASRAGICYLLGGEANVTTLDSGGEETACAHPTGGGRCSHLGLSFALRCFQLTSEHDKMACTLEMGLLAGASDGLDGPHAQGGGVWVSGWPNPTIREQAVSEAAKAALRLRDSYAFFNRYQPADVLPTKLTDTNVMDLIIAVVVVGTRTEK